MRLMLLSAFAVIVLAACQEAPLASEPGAAAAIESEAGQDDPDAPFSPAAPEPPRRYEPISKTAMAITGPLTVTPTASTGPHMPPGAIFTFGRGFSYSTTLAPIDLSQGGYDWNSVMPGVDPLAIQLYTVDSQDPAPKPGLAGLCDQIFAVAVGRIFAGAAGTSSDATGELFHIAAFSGDAWPPANPDTALCGTYMYAAMNDAVK